jgi:hypothetical protein
MTREDEAPRQADNIEVYESLGVDSLLMHCVKKVLDNGEECTLERLIFECFTLFPKKFCLSRYPQWPDSTRIYRSWRRCRLDNGWLSGSAQQGFRLTRKGEQIAQSVAVKLNEPVLVSKQTKEMSRTRGKEEAVVRYLRKSDAFRRWYKARDHFVITESELRSVLNTTLESPLQVLRENLDYYREMAGLMRDSVVLAFLGTCEEQHKDVMGGR